MASESRFTSQNKTTQERISSNTVGLVALSDFRKRRAEVLEQQEREAREAASSTSVPDRSSTSTPDNATNSAPPPKKKKKRKVGGAKLSFGDEEEEETDEKEAVSRKTTPAGEDSSEKAKNKFKVNTSLSVVPRPVTKSALRRETAERETLRREFLERQELVKATKIALPFVFYDGSNITGGTVHVKKGDFVWQFLDKSRKVGADLGVGEKANARRAWARVGVDDLMMVRNNVIIPHHYDFLFFIMNKTKGPNGTALFNYDTDAPKPHAEPIISNDTAALTTVEPPEGTSDDPTITKVVDRRWYSRNKHIYPASMWQDFDPEKDYQKEIRRDPGGNTFFYS
ncbi:XAP5, circadian clock regulator-domain-containing protein [Xylaria nigripes]|nr:XAP5, circadian clock regulator-domain-containing protein [Xylaria nigripes]